MGVGFIHGGVFFRNYALVMWSVLMKHLRLNLRAIFSNTMGCVLDVVRGY